MTHHGRFSPDLLHTEYPEPPILPDTSIRWVITRKDRVGVTGKTPASVIFHGKTPPGTPFERTVYLGHEGKIPVYAGEIPQGSDPPRGMEFSAVRELYGRVPDNELALASLAVRIIDFDRTTRYCGKCGSMTIPSKTERARRCPSCELVEYPRISPAIIVLIRRGDQILLARSPRFPPGMFSVIAGFVEPGEDLDHAIHREVREETGIAVGNIRYFGSEPWPFPHSLMIGFTADYAGGEIVVDAHEIESAFWFDRENLPRIPERMSIGRALIDWWVNGEKQL